MRHVFTVRNEEADELEITVEPWCFPYFVPGGSKLSFYYEAATTAPAQVTTAFKPGWLTIWFESNRPPEAELDGNAVEPMWR